MNQPRQIGAAREARGTSVLVQQIGRGPRQANRQFDLSRSRPTTDGLVGWSGYPRSAIPKGRGKCASQHVGLGHVLRGRASSQRGAQAAQVDGEEFAARGRHNETGLTVRPYVTCEARVAIRCRSAERSRSPPSCWALLRRARIPSRRAQVALAWASSVADDVDADTARIAVTVARVISASPEISALTRSGSS